MLKFILKYNIPFLIGFCVLLNLVLDKFFGFDNFLLRLGITLLIVILVPRVKKLMIIKPKSLGFIEETNYY